MISECTFSPSRTNPIFLYKLKAFSLSLITVSSGREVVKNPGIIFLNGYADAWIGQTDKLSRLSYLHAIMYKIADDETFSRFIDEHRLTDQIVTKTNVLQNTEYYQKILNIILYIHLAAGHDNQISALFGSRKKINSANTAKKSTGTCLTRKNRGI